MQVATDRVTDEEEKCAQMFIVERRDHRSRIIKNLATNTRGRGRKAQKYDHYLKESEKTIKCYSEQLSQMKLDGKQNTLEYKKLYHKSSALRSRLIKRKE